MKRKNYWLYLSLLTIFVLPTVAQNKRSSTVSEVVDRTQLATVTVTAPTVYRPQNAVFDVTFQVSDTTGQNITGYFAQVTFDNTVLQYNGCSATNTISSSFSIICNAYPTPNTISIFGYGVFPTTGEGPLFNLNFTAIAPPGNVSPLNFAEFYFNEGNPDDTDINGQVTILGTTAAPTSIIGQVTTAAGDPISAARVELIDTNGRSISAITNPFGYFRFDDIGSGQTFTVTTTAKRYTFASRMLTVNDEITGLNITADQ